MKPYEATAPSKYTFPQGQISIREYPGNGSTTSMFVNLPEQTDGKYQALEDFFNTAVSLKLLRKKDFNPDSVYQMTGYGAYVLKKLANLDE